MNITINYFGQLRQIAGMESESREAADGAPLADILAQAAENYDQQFGAILFDDNQALRASVMVLVNDVPADKDSLPALSDQDKVSLLPAIAGG